MASCRCQSCHTCQTHENTPDEHGRPNACGVVVVGMGGGNGGCACWELKGVSLSPLQEKCKSAAYASGIVP